MGDPTPFESYSAAPLPCGVLLLVTALLSGCTGKDSGNQPERPAAPLPETVEVRIDGPTEWNDSLAEINSQTRFKISLVSNPFDDREQLNCFGYSYLNGEMNSYGGGTLRMDKPEVVLAADQSAFVIATRGQVQYGVTDPYIIDLHTGRGVAHTDQVVSLDMKPAAGITLVVEPGSVVGDAAYDIESMDGTVIYADVHAAPKLGGGFRLVEADKQFQLRRIGTRKPDDDLHVIGPFKANTRNRVPLKPINLTDDNQSG